MKHVESQWVTYRAILSKDAGTTQIIETRRAFYAGAQALMYLMLSRLEPDAEPTENDLKMMSEIEMELSDFAKLVGNGVA